MVLGYLAYQMQDSDAQALKCIKHHWSSRISPWVEFLIEKFVLTNEEPSTVEGLDFVNNTLNIASLILLYPVFCIDKLSESRRLRHLSPKLRPEAPPCAGGLVKDPSGPVVVSGPLTPLAAADQVIFVRELVLNLAAKHGLHATFSPRPSMGTAGSAAHIHIS
ncbi:glutamine synthetase/guanido kinase, partial [Moniliophthora roreri MCA 2997]